MNRYLMKRSDNDLISSFFSHKDPEVRSELARRGYGLSFNTSAMLEIYDEDTNDLLFICTVEGVERL